VGQFNAYLADELSYWVHAQQIKIDGYSLVEVGPPEGSIIKDFIRANQQFGCIVEFFKGYQALEAPLKTGYQ
jgi:hypothetical protein